MKRFIVKADDMRLNYNISKFRSLISLCEKHSIQPSIGVIGSALHNGRYKDQRYIADLTKNGSIELWNHSFSHKDMTQFTNEQVAWEIARTSSECEKAFGLKPVGFGAPYNKFNKKIDKIATDLGIQYSYESLFTKFEYLTPEINVLFDGQPHFVEFMRRISSKRELPLIVMQIHPSRWYASCFSEFEKCILWLHEQGYVSTTAQNALANGKEKRQTIKDATKEVTSIHELRTDVLAAFWAKNAKTYNKTLSNFSTYYLPRFTKNAASIRDLLSELDVDLIGHHVADVGCGLAQWVIPFYEFTYNCRIYAFDTNKTIAQALTDAQENILLPNSFKILCEDFTKTTSIPPATLDIITCANAINYILIRDFIAKSSELCKNNAKLIILHQTSEFNHVGYKEAAQAGNLEMAKERALSELRQQAARSGFAGLLPMRTTYSLEEMESLFYIFKFEMYDDFVPSWERRENGVPIFQGSIFVKYPNSSLETLTPQERIELRKMVCRTGNSNLDDEIFSQNSGDLDDVGLSMLKARSGVMLKNSHAERFELDYTIAIAIKTKSYKIIKEIVLQQERKNVDLLLVAFITCIMDRNIKGAEEVFEAIQNLETSTRTLRLAESFYMLLTGEKDAALKTLSS